MAAVLQSVSRSAIAFSTQNVVRRSAAGVCVKRTVNTRLVDARGNRSHRCGRLLTTTSVSTDETLDELDAALESILSEVTAEKKSNNKVASGKTSTSRRIKLETVDGGEMDILPDENKKNKPHPVPSEFVEEDDVDYEDPELRSTSNPRWQGLGLSQGVIDVLSAKGITKFTPVQAEAFAPIVAGRDVIGRSRTGTGKTLAFGLPSITRLVELAKEKGTVNSAGRRKPGRNPSMIVLCPTRELARQVQDELAAVAKPHNLYTTVFHGGVSYDPQARDLRRGVDILVGTPGRVIDHLSRGNLDLSDCDITVLDEADEMLNMGFADDVETILKDAGSNNDERTQCLLFSATTPSWVKNIGRQYQEDVVMIDSTGATTARTATTVRHLAVQLPPGPNSKKSVLEDIIAVEISKDVGIREANESDEGDNEIAAAAMAKKNKSHGAMQQKIFGKTIVFTQTKKDADELVSGGVFKSLTAQALHGDVGQKQRDSTLNAFRAGAFNVLVATDVAARGIDIQDVDLVVQYEPPRDVDTYVHRSGRTGRAERTGTSVVLFDQRQSRDIVKIERELGHGFKFELVGPPSVAAALNAAAKTSAIACRGVPDETAEFFKTSAEELLAGDENPVDIVARCLAAISRRSTEVEGRSLLTGESGFLTVEMTNGGGRAISPGDVMFTVSKLARLSRKEGDETDDDVSFDPDVGKIQSNFETGSAMFDMSVEDAKKLVAFSQEMDNTAGAVFSIMDEIGIDEEGSSVNKGVAEEVMVDAVAGMEEEEEVVVVDRTVVTVEAEAVEVTIEGMMEVGEGTIGDQAITVDTVEAEAITEEGTIALNPAVVVAMTTNGKTQQL
eukprot:CAMPEP_0196813594 /NCGR_PEP_ID=MMETSP1362-20130617/37816_1 /TAXON_ID=163516 /ORGANISM="Leptocylindrus danicus, Strain CCMP1856" /LENGTH=841 /DNA_ID=CAMNT_0042189905 /DNA_START=190 /DNA_END=2716 /DNA_ORIENTATION=+